jgi:hypothetical protein
MQPAHSYLDLSVLLCVKVLHLVTMFCVLMHRFYCVRVVQVGRQLKQIPKLLSNFVAGYWRQQMNS